MVLSLRCTLLLTAAALPLTHKIPTTSSPSSPPTTTSLGRAASGNFSHAEWPSVPYLAGEIKAVAYDADNNTIATETIETTGAPAALKVSIKDGVGNSPGDGHGGGVAAGCNDVALVEVNVIDAKGRVVPNAANVVTLEVTGAGGALVFVGGGNGDPASHVSDKSHTRPAFHGKLLGVYATSAASTTAATATVTARSAGLTSGTVDIDVVVPKFERAWWCARHAAL